MLENKDKIVLHLCASEIGSDSLPYQRAGYDVRLITKEIGVEGYLPPENVYGIIANPPCTNFSFARTKAKIPRNLKEGFSLVLACLDIMWMCQSKIKNDQQRKAPLKFWVLENPDAMLRWFLGKPAMVFSPHEFGDSYQKKTALWGNFNEPKKLPLDLEIGRIYKTNNKTKIHTNSQPLKKFDKLLIKEIHPEFYGKMTRQDRRSICSEKFAQAFFEANK